MSSAVASTGSPVRRPPINRSQSGENAPFDDDKTPVRRDSTNMLKKSATALSSSKLANQAPKKMKVIHNGVAGDNDHMDEKKEVNPMDKLLARLSEQQATINRQNDQLVIGDDGPSYRSGNYTVNSSSSSVPVTPAITDTFETNTGPTGSPASFATDNEVQQRSDEVLRLQMELERAKGKLALMDQELIQSRNIKHTVDQAMSIASEADFPVANSAGHLDINGGRQNIARPQFIRDMSWQGQDDTRSDTSDALSAGGINRARTIWATNRQPYMNSQIAMSTVPDMQSTQTTATSYGSTPYMTNRGFGQMNEAFPSTFVPPIRTDRLSPEHEMMMSGTGDRRNIGQRSRYAQRSQFPYTGSNNSFDGAGAAPTYSTHPGYIGGPLGYQPPVGTPLSPFAPEFTAGNEGNYKNEAIATEGQTYLPTTEPLNYRRLLDRTVNCNWKYIVDKIVCNNDQQASIFLQQKLKVGTTEQKYEIVEAIVAQAYPLMVNRFGNFLVQRCFEHGTPEQVVKIAEAIRGNTLNLSMDAFGCHVVQKAFDSVPEDYKAIMVHELLRRIPETVIHRYACHVWQKLFELRWTESPPQIMKYVNEALRGMWHEVALGETGSLVVQNIFENCLEEDKRPCIEEVLEAIDVVAHGQFGNWCIQHICEHGSPADRGRAIDHVIRYATEYSMDQFASKVVEKCLKIGGSEFLHRYLDRVCEGRIDRPRIPLIDISSDQYGNYLIQYILTHSNPQDKEIVACHIRKHMVSLRGSKFGSRVGMLCNNPALATRPGPGAGSSAAPRMPPAPGPRYQGSYR